MSDQIEVDRRSRAMGTPCPVMRLLNGFNEILKIRKFRRIISYTGFYCFTVLVNYAYVNELELGIPRGSILCIVPCWNITFNRHCQVIQSCTWKLFRIRRVGSN
ncbi:uncharacterized protein [Euphorbia lathyris]|uniref:uncharacterized protein n=1 Tax=Euphorbia lathyris TaxID=212925 RepID=UPI00331358DA